MRRAWWQDPEVASHTAFTVKKQRQGVEWTEKPQDLPLLTHFLKLRLTLEPRHQAFKYMSL